MNSFFFKNLISSSANNKNNQEQEQSDFERLIELCNSYGLNEQQTKQLINEFKKGSYKSSTTSLNQSMVSEQAQDMSMSCQQQPDPSQHNYQYSQNSLEPSRTFQQQKNHPHDQEHQENYHQSQSSNRYYGYENDIQEKHQESYNEMTFNEQNNSLMLNSHRFHEGNGQMMHFNADSRMSTLKQEMIANNNKISDRRAGDKNFVQDNTNKPLDRNNSRKETLLQNRHSNQLNYPKPNQSHNTSQPTRTFNQSISNKTLAQQHSKGSFDYSKQQKTSQKTSKNHEKTSQQTSNYQEKTSQQTSNHYEKTSQQTSKYSQNSIQSHDIDNEPVNGLNPEYVKALIRNFELLEGENQCLKEENTALIQKSNALVNEYEIVKRENYKMKGQFQDMKNKEKFSSNQSAKFQALYEAEKQKNEMLMGMKEKDSEIIKGLKDSLMQLTELIKEKDTQNNELQQRLFSLYDKVQNQNSSSSSKYIGNQMNVNEFDQTGGLGQTYYGKSFSKKSLASSESEKSLKPTQEQQDEIRERNSNYGRKELTEMIANNINLPQNNRQVTNNMNLPQNNRQATQQSKQLARQPSVSRINSSSNDQNGYKNQGPNDQNGYKKQGPYPPSQPSSLLTRQSKQNVFTPLQVQPAIKRNVVCQNNTNKLVSLEQDKKRPSSRVDIKKYKGMIEELRNSYSNVGSNERILR